MISDRARRQLQGGNERSGEISVPRIPYDASDRFTKEEFELLNEVVESFSHDDTNIVKVRGLNFQVWKCSLPEKYGICLGIISSTVEIESEDVMLLLFNLVHEIAIGYQDHPYHAFDHAVDTTYVAYLMLKELRADLRLGFSLLHRFTLLLSALAHDVLHPGYSNSFLNTTNSEISSKYDLQSPLEKQSYDYLLKALDKFPILSCLDFPGYTKEETKKVFENLVYNSLLGTDVAYHLEHVKFLQEVIQEYYVRFPTLRRCDMCDYSSHPPDRPSHLEDSSLKKLKFQSEHRHDRCYIYDNKQNVGDMPHLLPIRRAHLYKLKSGMSHNHSFYMSLTKEQISVFVSVLLHAADLSNAARPYHICKYWSDRVCKEFYNQGDREKELNLPISPNMDRNTSRSEQIALDFSVFIVHPYYEILSIIIPTFVVFLDYIIDNEIRWKIKNCIAELASANKYEKAEKLTSILGPKNTHNVNPPEVSRIRSFSTAAGLFKPHTSREIGILCNSTGYLNGYGLDHLSVQSSSKPHGCVTNSSPMFFPGQVRYYTPDLHRRCLSLGSIFEFQKRV